MLPADISAWSAGLRPEPEVFVDTWADEFRVLSTKGSAEAFNYRTARTPYWREPARMLSVSSRVRKVVVMKPRQVGATELSLNWMGCIMHKWPGPAMWVQPTVDMAKRLSKQRIATMIEECPELRSRVREARSRNSGNTLQAKEFPGGMLIIVGANSAAGLRQMPVRFLCLDEVDAYPLDVGGEGSPVDITEAALDTFGAKAKILIISTPTIRGLSRVEIEFNRTDQRYYYVACPFCKREQRLQFRESAAGPGHLVWPDGKPKEAKYLCERCSELIPEHRKTWMLEHGTWVPTAPADTDVVGYHLNSLYSPLGWKSWGAIAHEFVTAKRQGQEALKTFVNIRLAETWQEETELVDAEILHGRREQYAAPVPRGALAVTAGVDVHDNRLEVGIWGFGLGEESWAVDRVVLYGDTKNLEHPVWQQLDELLLTRWKHESGADLEIGAGCVDSGYLTDVVYAWVAPREIRRIYAIKGRDGPGRPIVSAPTKTKTGKRPRPVQLFTVGSDTAKARIFARLALRKPGPGFCHFPESIGDREADAFDESYFEQLTNEKAVTQYLRGFPKRVWVRVGPNEPLDLFQYALAALYIWQPAFPLIQRRLEELERSAGRTQDPVAPRIPHRPKKNWAMRW